MRKLMFALLIAAVVLGCGGTKEPEKVVITVGQGTDPVILDPPMYSDTPTHNLNLIIYNRLYDLSSSGKIEPDLAVDLPKIEENGTLYTIKIREGVKFHNGSPLTIDDVIFSFQRGAFHEKSQMKSIFVMMYDVKKIDDYTFSFRTGRFDQTKAPAGTTDADLKSFEARTPYYKPVSFGSQLNQLTWLGASVVDKETLEKAQGDGTIKDYGVTWAVGTGPFKFESWAQGDSVTLVRNPDYYDKTIKSNADKIVFKTIKDPSALKTAFLNKEVDLIMNVVPLDAREIEKQGGKILTTNGYFGYHYLAFNMKSPKVGEVTKTAVLRAEAELSGARSDLIKARNLLKYSKAVLKRVVGLEDEFEIVDTHTAGPTGLKDISEANGDPVIGKCPGLKINCLIEMAINERAELKSSSVQKDIARAQVTYTKGSFWPTLAVEGVFQQKKETPETSGLIRDNLYGGVRVVFPFFEGGLRVAEVQEAEAKKRQTDYAHSDLKKTVTVEVESSYLDFITQKGVLKSLEDQYVFAEDNYKAVSKQFDFGLAQSIDVMDANTLLVTAERQLIDALYRFQQAIVRLKKATGTLLVSLGPKTSNVENAAKENGRE